MNRLNDKGFTLIEMMIVMVIISMLLLIAVPSVTKNKSVASSKGCEATVKLIQTQVRAYELENSVLPTDLETLKTAEYIDTTTCPDGGSLVYDETNGKVTSN
ncbi:competence type IV pilus major pilin ComGC [Pseudalkalibacillus caeni]|uniref:ComG operon protein 3 n=1 Tax=Exobacillus caeni TaxID=2574798 RepID=A0A5R9EYG2_9BACL|nr:competence type IV pilus major pilin ComGC [Pseudalkalibacillus caeni]TLS36342.1 prepilin-type N-terminal cleavage/methylation domain-containing protein [Pseudalkalibacillus caeni]